MLVTILNVLSIARWIVSVLFLLFFLYQAIINAGIIFYTYVLKKKGSSMIPLAGGFFGTLGILLFPLGESYKYWWLPLFLDYGSIPLIIHTLINNFRTRD